MHADKTQEIIHNTDNALKSMANFFKDNLSLDNTHIEKMNKLAFWIKDYIKYLSEEEEFRPNKLKRYERGDIIKANLGFNVGSEQGGLHYCIVLDNNNSLYSPTLTVIPLSSIKNKEINSKYKVNLGTMLYTKLKIKADALYNYCISNAEKLKSQALTCKANDTTLEEIDLIEKQLSELYEELDVLKKTKKEISKLKLGSVALIHQITTISKQRIYNPKKNRDILSGIKLSPQELDLINAKILELFLHK